MKSTFFLTAIDLYSALQESKDLLNRGYIAAHALNPHIELSNLDKWKYVYIICIAV